MMQSKSQKYSDQVFNQVNKHLNNNTQPELLDKYKSLCKRAGGIMRTVGLIQFLTFLAAKGTKDAEKHHQYLLDDLIHELGQNNIINKNGHQDSFLEEIRKQQLPEYMRTTNEVLKFLQWHKRIAEILIQKGA